MDVFVNVAKVLNSDVTLSSPFSNDLMRSAEPLQDVTVTIHRARWFELGEPSMLKVTIEPATIEDFKGSMIEGLTAMGYDANADGSIVPAAKVPTAPPPF